MERERWQPWRITRVTRGRSVILAWFNGRFLII
jgi:hypothetical protein